MINRWRRLIFIHIPKNAGTSITASLRLEETVPKPIGRVLHRAKRFPLTAPFFRSDLPSHATARAYRERYPREFDQYFKFAFVRNPFDRELSLYRYISANEAHRLHNVVVDMSFQDFLRWRAASNPRRQCDFLYDENGLLLVDFVGRFENLANDYRLICDRVGIRSEIKALNRSQRTRNLELYDDISIEIVLKTFDLDFKLLDYARSIA